MKRVCFVSDPAREDDEKGDASGRTRLVPLIGEEKKRGTDRLFATRNKLSLNLQRHLRPNEQMVGFEAL